MAYWSNRDGDGFRTPATAIDEPKCILINQYAGSGGDAFPHYFRLAGVGPVIGKRTWGGLVGISHDLPLERHRRARSRWRGRRAERLGPVCPVWCALQL